MREQIRLYSIRWLWLLPLIMWPRFSFAEDKGDPEFLVELALKSNPGLKAIDYQLQSLQHKVESASRWKDPVLSIEYSNFPTDTWKLGESPMTGLQFRLQQNLTLIGKNDKREATAQAEWIAQAHILSEKRVQLAYTVRRVYWRLTRARLLDEITRKHIELVNQLIETVRYKYQTGASGQHDLLRLKLLQNKLQDDLQDFSRLDQELTSDINGALHREPAVSIATPGNVTAITPTLDYDQAISLAKSERPAIRFHQARAEMNRLAADQMAYERWPDLSVWAGYRVREPAGMDEGDDLLSIGIGLPLPFDYTDRYAAEQAMQLTQASAADEEASAVLDQIQAQLGTAFAVWSRAAQQSQTYTEQLIPDARRTLESTQAAYQSDRADFASLYQAELQLLQFERTLRIAQTQSHEQEATVLMLTGRIHPIYE